MLQIEIPGREQPLRLDVLVLDYNGTIACDGQLIDGIGERIRELCTKLPVYILTADTYGTQGGDRPEALRRPEGLCRRQRLQRCSDVRSCGTRDCGSGHRGHVCRPPVPRRRSGPRRSRRAGSAVEAEPPAGDSAELIPESADGFSKNTRQTMKGSTICLVFLLKTDRKTSVGSGEDDLIQFQHQRHRKDTCHGRKNVVNRRVIRPAVIQDGKL